MNSSGYLGMALKMENIPVIVKALESMIRKASILRSFSSIAFRGMSGALIVPALALCLRKHITLVRKEASHSNYAVEGCVGGKGFIIVDDLISTGDTIEKILQAIYQKNLENDSHFKPKDCRAVFLYRSFRKSDIHCRYYRGESFNEDKSIVLPVHSCWVSDGGIVAYEQS